MNLSDEKVYVVVLNYNNYEYTIECVKSLLRLNYRNYEVVVCDNKSTDNSYECIAEWIESISNDVHALEFEHIEAKSFHITLECGGSQGEIGRVRVTLIQTGFNGGFAYGNNVGLKFALSDPDCKYFWILNNDTLVESSALSALVSRIRQDSRLGIVGSVLKNYDPPHEVQAYGGAVYSRLLGWAKPLKMDSKRKKCSNEDIEEKINYVIGASMFVSRDFLDQIGLLSEDYFLYFEELDWAWRSKGQFRIGVAVDSVVMHRLGATTGEKSSSSLSKFHLFRSRTIFLLKHEFVLMPFWFISTMMYILLTTKRHGISCGKAAFLGAFGLPVSKIMSLVRG